MHKILFVVTLAGSITAGAAPLKPIAHGCFFEGEISDASSPGTGTISCFSKTGEVLTDDSAAVVLQGIVDMKPIIGKPIFIQIATADSIDQIGGEYLLSNSDNGPIGTRADGLAGVQITIPGATEVSGAVVGIYPSDSNMNPVVYRRGLAGPGYYRGGVYRGHPVARGAVVGGAIVGGAVVRRNYCSYHPYRCY